MTSSLFAGGEGAVVGGILGSFLGVPGVGAVVGGAGGALFPGAVEHVNKAITGAIGGIFKGGMGGLIAGLIIGVLASIFLGPEVGIAIGLAATAALTVGGALLKGATGGLSGLFGKGDDAPDPDAYARQPGIDMRAPAQRKGVIATVLDNIVPAGTPFIGSNSMFRSH